MQSETKCATGKKMYHKGKRSVSQGTRLRNGTRGDCRSWGLCGGESRTHLPSVCCPSTHAQGRELFHPRSLQYLKYASHLAKGLLSTQVSHGRCAIIFTLSGWQQGSLCSLFLIHQHWVQQLPSSTGSPVMAVVLVGAEFQIQVTPLWNCGAQADWGDDF